MQNLEKMEPSAFEKQPEHKNWFQKFFGQSKTDIQMIKDEWDKWNKQMITTQKIELSLQEQALQKMKEMEYIQAPFDGQITFNQPENISGYQKEKELVEGVFLVSQSCNMKCRYCYGESGEFGNKGFMDKKMAEEYFRLFLKLGGSLKLQKVRFLGGEPFMNFPIIQYIVSLWEEWKKDYPSKTVLFSVTTNGTMFTDEILRYIAEKKISITISLDGPETIQNRH